MRIKWNKLGNWYFTKNIFLTYKNIISTQVPQTFQLLEEECLNYGKTFKHLHINIQILGGHLNIPWRAFGEPLMSLSFLEFPYFLLLFFFLIFFNLPFFYFLFFVVSCLQQRLISSKLDVWVNWTQLKLLIHEEVSYNLPNKFLGVK